MHFCVSPVSAENRLRHEIFSFKHLLAIYEAKRKSRVTGKETNITHVCHSRCWFLFHQYNTVKTFYCLSSSDLAGALVFFCQTQMSIWFWFILRTLLVYNETSGAFSFTSAGCCWTCPTCAVKCLVSAQRQRRKGSLTFFQAKFASFTTPVHTETKRHLNHAADAAIQSEIYIWNSQRNEVSLVKCTICFCKHNSQHWNHTIVTLFLRDTRPNSHRSYPIYISVCTGLKWTFFLFKGEFTISGRKFWYFSVAGYIVLAQY